MPGFAELGWSVSREKAVGDPLSLVGPLACEVWNPPPFLVAGRGIPRNPLAALECLLDLGASNESQKMESVPVYGSERASSKHPNVDKAMTPLRFSACIAAAIAWMSAAGAADLVAAGASNSVVLAPNSPAQKVRWYLENRGTQAHSILGGTFFFTVSGPSPAALTFRPRITGVNMLGLEQSPLDSSRMMQSSFQGSDGEWMTTLEINSFSAGFEVVVPAGGRWPLCELELDTTGLMTSSVAWMLRMDAVQEGFSLNSFFNTPSAVDPADVLEVPVLAQPMELRFETVQPPELRPIMARFGATPGSLVFEVPGEAGATPRIEYTDDLARGGWRLVEAQPVRVEAAWRWELPADAAVTARFFRTISGLPGAGAAERSDR